MEFSSRQANVYRLFFDRWLLNLKIWQFDDLKMPAYFQIFKSTHPQIISSFSNFQINISSSHSSFSNFQINTSSNYTSSTHPHIFFFSRIISIFTCWPVNWPSWRNYMFCYFYFCLLFCNGTSSSCFLFLIFMIFLSSW